MNLNPVFAAMALALALPGCVGGCPYQVDSIFVWADSTAYFGVENATRAQEALRELGFQATRDGLHVEATQPDLEVILELSGSGTSMLLRYDIGHREFRTHEAASAYLEEHRAEAMARIDATQQAFEDAVGWPAFTREPSQDSISIC